MRGYVQRKGDHRDHNRRQAGPGKDPVVEQEKQHQHGSSPQDRDIYGRETADDRIFPGAQQADQSAQQRTDQQRQGRDLDRDSQAAQDCFPGAALDQNFV